MYIGMRAIFRYLGNRFVAKIINLFKREEKEARIDEIWEILKSSYELAGLGDVLMEKEELYGEDIFIKAVKRGEEITAVKVYTTKRGGRKSIASGQNRTGQGKEDYKMLVKEDIRLKNRGVWLEASGKVKKMMEKYGAVIIPASVAKQILYDKDIEIIDKCVYTRKIGDMWVEKSMFGNIEKVCGVLEERGIDISEYMF